MLELRLPIRRNITLPKAIREAAQIETRLKTNLFSMKMQDYAFEFFRVATLPPPATSTLADATV